ncbi:MAG TPA: 50S ribosomal protein L25/general stress protein Ctc [Candidatus Luteimonas excrementigallinarum]|nr:50S ribosomal protein L25/general stress protein Ctc [Candidatus Luteimonas excrementigallinarum]
MSISQTIQVQRREDEGKGASRRLRRSGQVPAIVYGGDLAPVSIQLSHNDVLLASEHEWFYSSILDLSLNGDVQKVLLRDLQRHPYKQQILHLDFQRVTADEKLRTSVPLNFINEEISPAGKLSDVLVSHELREVTVECLPANLPGSIDVDLAALTLGDTLYLSDIQLPEGVEIPQLALGKDHDDAIVTARPARVEVEEESAEGDEQSADVPAAKVSDDADKKDD